MKYLLLVFSFFIFSCKITNNKIKTTLDPMETAAAHDNYADSVIKAGENRILHIISLIKKRDSFMIEKYKNEVLYYQTERDIYRVRANRMIDSFNRYIHIVDSVANQKHTISSPIIFDGRVWFAGQPPIPREKVGI